MDVGVALGVAEVAPVSAEPDHEKVFAPPEALALKVTVPPIHIGPVLVGAAAGVLCTETDVVYTVEGLQPLSDVPSLTVSE